AGDELDASVEVRPRGVGLQIQAAHADRRSAGAELVKKVHQLLVIRGDTDVPHLFDKKGVARQRPKGRITADAHAAGRALRLEGACESDGLVLRRDVIALAP